MFFKKAKNVLGMFVHFLMFSNVFQLSPKFPSLFPFVQHLRETTKNMMYFVCHALKMITSKKNIYLKSANNSQHFPNISQTFPTMS